MKVMNKLKMAVAAVADNPVASLLGHPITAFLLVCTVLVVLSNIPFIKRITHRSKA